MASSKEYRDFVLEQFDMVPGLSGRISCRPMMGKFSGLEQFGMAEAIPYEGGKAMWLVECVDEPERLGEIVKVVVDGLKKK